MSATSNPKKKLSEKELKELKNHLELFNARDLKGLKFFYDRDYETVENLIDNKFRNCPEKDIIVNESFRKTWRTSATFETVGSLMSYIKTVAYHECVNYYHKLKKENKLSRSYQLVNLSSNPEEDLQMHLNQQLVVEAFHGMPDGILKQILEDTELKELDNDELSVKYNMPKDKLRVYQSRAREQLRNRFFLLRKKNLGY